MVNQYISLSNEIFFHDHTTISKYVRIIQRKTFIQESRNNSKKL